MPLQDRPDYKEWIARRLEQEAHFREGDEKEKEVTKCDGCGIPVSKREFIGERCIECLAFEFGGVYTHGRIADGIRAIMAALNSPESARALVMHGLDRLGDLLSDLEHLRDAT
ncbi:MAG TPA: hypothetical protein VHF90_05975 [Thermoleophilaceae bacterium]|nr:hypothetical protein [Thermoleophilaceae bacterium]